MKFLCSHCGSKYQITDDKVQGRVLRMKCRKCSQDIVIDGQNPTGPSVRPPAAQGAAVPQSAGLRLPTKPQGAVAAESVGRRTANVPAVKGPAPAAPSSLGTGFKKQVSSRPTAGASVSQAGGADQWHVAVNEVPVGPIGKQEILRKMNAGAVTDASLVWREGFDDWRPLREVPELAALLRQAASQRVPPPPIARASAVPQPPRPGKAPAAHKTGPHAHQHPHRAGDGLKPAARSNVVPMPIGGRSGAAPAPQVDEGIADTAIDGEIPAFAPFEPEPEAAPVPARRASIPAAPVAAQMGADAPMFPAAPQGAPVGTISSSGSVARPMPAPEKKTFSPGVLMGIAGAAFFGVTMAVILGTRVLGGGAAPAPAPTPAPVVVAPAQPEKAVEAPVVLPDDVEVTTPVEPADTGAGSTKSTRSSTKGSTGAKAPELSEAEKKRLAAMAGGTTTEFDKFKGTNEVSFDKERPKAQAGSLSGDQIKKVVDTNKPALQRCYERSARGVGASSDLRVNVDLTIGRSGKVSSVKTSGADLPGFGTCLEGAIKRWVFPPAGDETPARFPLLFAGK
jgi:predicted Zn finger-like uncharacterized protein